ncbi:glycosyltransferase [Sutcliffiella horikoshii]|uniref:glycosyltransferase n=1 Tax=Sutcliffiella horikoshii TaxID=79883 RepID=UPI001F472621|nr:glycosyltransferase [Sutcliffiella horikoshii]MCG1021556.1 glycosyltransferase family 1 protein [Sutcliffiella horikoshii]
MKKIIVYFPYELKEQKSGSSVRPIKMIEAFRDFGKINHKEIIEIYGNSRERKLKLKKLYTQIDPNDIECCYTENATIPLWLTDRDHIPRNPFLDIGFYKYLQKNNIPLGLFYRDIYWKFDELYKVNSFVKPIMQSLFKFELAIYKKYVTCFYLPSIYMNEYLELHPVEILPPGGTDLTNFRQNPIDKEVAQAIYVGGIHPRYGVYEMLEAVQNINNSQMKVSLTLVCREREFHQFKELFAPYLNSGWLNLIHAHGEQLVPLYKNADFGIVPIKKDFYNDFAVAVKLFEYISYGLPVVATNCSAQKDLVEDGEFGVVVEDNAIGLEKGISEMLHYNKRQQYEKNAIESLKQKHLWLERTKTVYSSLMHSKN